jgi:hypothetical protein
MVSILPPTGTWAVRTVAAAALWLAAPWLAAGAALAVEVPTEAAVIPPAAATTATPMLAIMILGCCMIPPWMIFIY